MEQIMTNLNRPLWQAMRRAEGSLASDYQSPEARVLRAIVDAMEDRFGLFSGDALMLLDWLRDEADRAEAGE
jgi:hypothetical protein